MDFTLGIGSPDTDIGSGVSLAWVHLRRSTVVIEVSTALLNKEIDHEDQKCVFCYKRQLNFFAVVILCCLPTKASADIACPGSA